MAAELEIRAGTEADVGRILELLRLSLGEGRIPRERSYWEWKHLRNPFGESPVLLAEAGGELVGLRVFMRWEWEAGAERLRTVRAVDTATHPEWQGRGIFSRLTKALVQQVTADGVHFIFNTPNDKSRPGYLKMGWQAVGRTDIWIRPRRPLRILRAIARKGIGSDSERAISGPEFQSVEALCRAPGLPGLLRGGLNPPSRLSTPKTADYLRWRYGDIPGFRYHALYEIAGGDGAAIVFRYKDQGELLELRICEQITGTTRASRQIANFLLRRLQKEGEADYLSAMAGGGSGEQGRLLRVGFLPALRLGPVLTVRPLNAVPADLNLLSRRAWRISTGDLELF